MPLCRIFNSDGSELLHFHTDAFGGLRRIAVGRSSQCQVCLKNVAETTISREHFRLERSGDDWRIVDADSRAGVVYNCEKIRSMRLDTGMVLRFGRLYLGFGDKALASTFRLEWENPLGETEYGLLWPGKNSVGASRDNYVTIRLGDIARYHLIAEVQGGQLYISPISPMAQCWVNGTLVDERMQVRIGDVIGIGGVEVRVAAGEAQVFSALAADLSLADVEDVLPPPKSSKSSGGLQLTGFRPTKELAGAVLLAILAIAALGWAVFYVL